MSRINQPWISEAINSEKSLLLYPRDRTSTSASLWLIHEVRFYCHESITIACYSNGAGHSNGNKRSSLHGRYVPSSFTSSFTVLDRVLYYKSFQHRWIIDDGELVVVQGGHREMFHVKPIRLILYERIRLFFILFKIVWGSMEYFVK